MHNFFSLTNRFLLLTSNPLKLSQRVSPWNSPQATHPDDGFRWLDLGVEKEGCCWGVDSKEWTEEAVDELAAALLKLTSHFLVNSIMSSMHGTVLASMERIHSARQGSVIIWTARVARKCDESVPAIEMNLRQGRQKLS